MNQGQTIIDEVVRILREKDYVIEMWRDRAYSLSSKNKQCYICFSTGNWIPETLTCQNCHNK